MANSNALYAGTAANVYRSGEEYPWNNPDNAKTEADYTNTIGDHPTGQGHTDWLRLTNFGFEGAGGVPSGVIIKGIEVKIRHMATAYNEEWVRDDDIYLRNSSGQIGENKASAVHWPSDPEIVTYGNSTDMWGTTLTADDIRSSSFGIDISAWMDKTSGRIYYVTIKVYYSVEFEYVGTGTFAYSGEATQIHSRYYLYAGSGNFITSGSGICQYEKTDWEYAGSGNFVFSGTGVYSIGFAFTGSGSLTYLGEAEQYYTYNFSYVSSGDFVFSGSGICQYEKTDWEYAGSGELTYSGVAIATIGFVYIGSGTYNFSGVGLYGLGLFYIGSGEFAYSGIATQVYTWCYLYAGSGIFTYSGEAVLRWGDWTKIGKGESDWHKVEKLEDGWIETGKEKDGWEKIDKL